MALRKPCAVDIRIKSFPLCLATYRVTWRAADDEEPINHLVVARNPGDARRISRAALRRAVASEFKSWKIGSVA